MKFIYIDVETTGLDPKVDSILQIAGIIKDENGEVPFNFRIKPYKNLIVDSKVTELTGITQEEADSYPDQAIAFRKFKSLIAPKLSDMNNRYFIIGYNVEFDMDFLREWFTFNNDRSYKSLFYFPPIDVMQLAAIVLVGDRPYLRNFKLTTVYEHVLGHPFANAHNAFADIYATKELFDALFVRLRQM